KPWCHVQVQASASRRRKLENDNGAILRAKCKRSVDRSRGCAAPTFPIHEAHHFAAEIGALFQLPHMTAEGVAQRLPRCWPLEEFTGAGTHQADDDLGLSVADRYQQGF